MSTITFNSLKFSQRLEKAGATREYAIAEAEALSEVFESGTQDLATKNDLSIVKNELKSDLERGLSPIRNVLAVLKWMVGMSLALSWAARKTLLHSAPLNNPLFTSSHFSVRMRVKSGSLNLFHRQPYQNL